MKALRIISTLYLRSWRSVLLVGSLSIIAYVLYFHRLGNLVGGYAPLEQATLAHSSDWHHIFTNPVNAPYAIILWLCSTVLHVFQGDILLTRIIAASFGILWALVFYLVAKHWFPYRTAFLGTLLFATSSGFLHNARLGAPYILQMAILATIGLSLLYKEQRTIRTQLGYALAVLFATLWYVPGMIWILLFSVVLFRTSIVGQFKRMPRAHVIGWVATATILVLPLVIACATHSNTLLDMLGLPHSIHSLKDIGSNLGNTLLAIGIRSPGDPTLWINHTRLLTVAESVFLLLGFLYYVWINRSYHSYFLLGSLGVCLILIALGGNVSYASIIPLVYLLITRGITQFISEWLAVFPRNPIARLAGMTVVCIVLSFSVLYQIRSYFVAWPHTTATQATFTLPGRP